MKFEAFIEDNTIKFYSPELVYSYLKSNNGKRVTVDISRHYSPRTNDQNKYYWGVVVNMLSDYTGFTDEEMHNLLKNKFLTKHKIIKDKLLVSSYSTTELDTAQFSDYIEKIKDWASIEFSLYIPNANEYYGTML